MMVLNIPIPAAGAYPNPTPAVDARKNFATPSDWDHQKDTIRRLYLDENKKLDEVMSIMSHSHGFNAT
jgi:hypothetical protein